MALDINNIDILEVCNNANVTGDNKTFTNTTVRSFYQNRVNSTYNYGSAGLPQGGTDEIALGEFRGASTITNVFQGTLNAKYRFIDSGDDYVPDTYHSGYDPDLVPTLGSFSYSSASQAVGHFNGTIGGRTSTRHDLGELVNTRVFNQNGVITVRWYNATGTYSSTATDWNYLNISRSGSSTLTLYRTSAQYISVQSFYISGAWQYRYTAQWGNFNGNPTSYNFNPYFNLGSTNSSTTVTWNVFVNIA